MVEKYPRDTLLVAPKNRNMVRFDSFAPIFDLLHLTLAFSDHFVQIRTSNRCHPTAFGLSIQNNQKNVGPKKVH